MAMTVTPEKVNIPSPGDTFGYMAEQRQMAASQRTIVQVADRTEGEAVATAMAADGRPVSDANPLFVYNVATRGIEIKDGTGWRGGLFTPPFGHMGRKDGFQTVSGLTVVAMSAAQILRGGMTFDDATDSLVIPLTGLYRVRLQGMFSGGACPTVITQPVLAPGTGTMPAACASSGPKPDGQDVRYYAECVTSFSAGMKVQLTQNQPGGGAVSAWGTNGYDGSYLEVEWLGV